MVLAGYSNLSALKAYGLKMGATSNNIANGNSDGFKKSRALLKEGPNNNVEVEIDCVETAGHTVFEGREGENTERELSNVDLAEEIPRTIPIVRGYEANSVAIKTQEEMLGSIVDIIS